MSSHSRQQLEDWLKTIDIKSNSLLDVGGSQLPIKGRTKSWDVNNYRILDIEQPHEVKRKPDNVGDIQNYRGFDNVHDVVFCIEVSEYWHNPLQALINIHRALKMGGILYISYHSTYPLHKPTGKDYLRYTYYGIEKLLTKVGFEIETHDLRHIKREKQQLDIYLAEFKPDKEDIARVLSSGGMIKAIKKKLC